MRSSLGLLRTLRQGVVANGVEGLKQVHPALRSGVATLASTESGSSSSSGYSSKAQWAVAVGGVLTGIFGTSMVAAGDEVAEGLHHADYPFDHKPHLNAYDHGSIRRGHQVYQQICAACHSMKYLQWRKLVGVCYTEEEAKALAADTEVTDGPNDEGEMFTRPGRLADTFPAPYANEQAARYANGGAYPPDLSVIEQARHGGGDYLFALLTGYREPPAGIKMREGLHYNPYFPGGAIAMPKMLVDGATEYDDGTPANASQQAKDLVTFLYWASNPYQDEMRVMGIKAVLVSVMMWGFLAYSKRLRWAPLKSQRIISDVVN